MTRPPPIDTPSPIASICIIVNRLLPLPASACDSPFNVTPFIAANCIEFAVPNTISSALSSSGAGRTDTSANPAIAHPTIPVFTTRNAA